MFLSTAPAFLEAHNQYQAALREFREDVKTRIEAHNIVVHNLAKKFNSELVSYAAISTRCKIVVDPSLYKSHNAEFVNFGDSLVPVALLRNDPIASAVYVRRQIRVLQRQKRDEALKRYETELATARRAQTVAANNVARIEAAAEAHRKRLGLTKAN